MRFVPTEQLRTAVLTPFVAYAAGSRPAGSRVLLFALATIPIVIADALSTQIALAAIDPCYAEMYADHIYAFAPRAAILSVTMLFALLAWERHLLGSAPRAAAPSPGADEWLDFPEAPLLKLRAADVVQIRAAGNYSEIVARDRNYLVRATLSDLARRLAPRGFVRIHRGTVINAAHVRSICRDATGRAFAHLAGGGSVPVGRSYISAIHALTRD